MPVALSRPLPPYNWARAKSPALTRRYQLPSELEPVPKNPEMLTDGEKAAVRSLWAKVAGNVEDLGGEALERLFLTNPQCKTYFSHFDVSSGSADIRSHGAKVLSAIGAAADHLDDIEQALSKLSDLHAYNLRVDPGNFKLLSHSIQTVLAAHFPEEFTPETHAAWDKYLAAVSAVLTCKYR